MDVTTQQGQVGQAVGQPGLAKNLVAGDRILVTVTAKKPEGRVSISKVFDHTGSRIDNEGNHIEGASLNLDAPTAQGAEPEFDIEAFRTMLIKGNKSGADEMSRTYQTALLGYKQQGGTTAAERIGNAVYANLQAEDGVSPNDGPHLVLRREQVVAKAPFRGTATEPGVWLVQLAPTWGTL